MRSIIGKFSTILLLASGLCQSAAIAQSCPPGALATPKNSALYLYFGTSSDSTFPSYGQEYGELNTTPIAPFDMAQHDASLSTAQVQQRAHKLLQAAYCEFDVNVKLATSTPAPSEARWQIVGLGSDASSSGLVGLAQEVDTGDNFAQDFSRVWADSLESYCGASLSGANSTPERWATAIANLAAHESAHNYGAMHSESAPGPGEDGAPNHFEADPAAGATAAKIAGRLNHFSDTTYERFGHDIGLNFETLHNWDFVNPNGSDADTLVMTFLSSAGSLTLGGVYIGGPWTSPVVTKRAGTIPFRGTAYNVFDLTFSTPQPWSGGPAGVVPPAVKFHVGASFTQPDPVIVFETNLRSGANDLPLKPRMFGYNVGTSPSGFYGITFFNQQAAAGELILSDLQVLFLPRMIDLDQMVGGGQFLGLNGENVRPFPRVPGGEREQIESARADLSSIPTTPVRIGSEPLFIPVARLTDRRHLDVTIDSTGCVQGREPQSQQPGFGLPGVRYCPTNGIVLSLFPATYVYVIATVIDPNAQVWDPAQNRVVTAPLTTKLFFQAAGTLPDFNQNEIDDLIDIRSGTSSDDNTNGIPDEAEKLHPLAVIAHIGAAIPSRSTASNLDAGLSLDLNFEYALKSKISLLGILGLHRLSDGGLGSELKATQIAIDGRYYFASARVFRAFVQAGLSAYVLDPGDTEIGENIGAGVQYELTPRLSFEALYSYHAVNSGGPADTEFSVPHIGLRWSL
jgi:hypothetical protein